jgi:outer membrane biosynthesis protein TonB
MAGLSVAIVLHVVVVAGLALSRGRTTGKTAAAPPVRVTLRVPGPPGAAPAGAPVASAAQGRRPRRALARRQVAVPSSRDRAPSPLAPPTPEAAPAPALVSPEPAASALGLDTADGAADGAEAGPAAGALAEGPAGGGDRGAGGGHGDGDGGGEGGPPPPPVEIAASVMAKQCLHCPAPSLPVAERRAGATLTIRVRICLDDRGGLAAVELLQGLSRAADAAVLQTIGTWRHRPYVGREGPQPVCTRMRFEFVGR